VTQDDRSVKYSNRVGIVGSRWDGCKACMVVVIREKKSALVVNVQGVRRIRLSNRNVGGACTYVVLQPLAPRDPPAAI
jgi:hypothetical protein